MTDPKRIHCAGEVTRPMSLADLERRQVAVEWDMGWFCEKCWKLQPRNNNACIIGRGKYCETCAEDILIAKAKGEPVTDSKGALISPPYI